MKTENSCKSGSKSLFAQINLEPGEVFQRKNFLGGHCILFFLSGEVEVIYSGSRPLVVSGGNMIFLARLSDSVVEAKSHVCLILLTFEELGDSCDKFTFQNLVTISSLLKYEFDKLEIRRPLDGFLELVQIYINDCVPGEYLWTEKQKELFILFRTYYENEELAMFFYPLIGKNMDFKKMVFDTYPKVKNIKDFAEKSGYSPVVFQRRFKDVFGEPVYQWIQRQKAEHIKHLLMTESMNLKDLTDEYDFVSPAHLNKFCKIWFGMSPSELKETLLLKRKLK